MGDQVSIVDSLISTTFEAYQLVASDVCGHLVLQVSRLAFCFHKQVYFATYYREFQRTLMNIKESTVCQPIHTHRLLKEYEKWLSADTRLTIDFICCLMSDLVI